jgi:hypothetical protein
VWCGGLTAKNSSRWMVVAGGEREVGPGRDPVMREKRFFFLFFILYFNFVYAFDFNIGNVSRSEEKPCRFLVLFDFYSRKKKGLCLHCSITYCRDRY